MRANLISVKPETLSHRIDVPSGGDKNLEKASRMFEETVIGILVREMWKTVPKGGLVRQSTGMDVAEEMYQKELAKEMSRAGGVGLSREILEQFRKDFPGDAGWPSSESGPPNMEMIRARERLDTKA